MQLHAAAARGDRAGMEFALKRGTDVNARNGMDQTPLVFALERAKAFSRRGGPLVDCDTVEFLVGAGADLEATDHLDMTAVHHAAATGNPELVELLLGHGANARHITRSGYSVLTHACYQPAGAAKEAIVRRLHDAGAFINSETEYREFPLGVCQYFGDFDSIRVLIQLGADPTPLNWTPLHQAVALGDMVEIAGLNPSQADLNAVNSRFELSPWMLSIMRGDLSIVRWMADRGGDLEQSGRCGESLLHLASRYGQSRVVRWLLEVGADANAKNNFLDTPLHEACGWDHLDCVKVLLENGADAKRENHVRIQPVHAAESVSVLAVIAREGGADLNAVDGCGEWALKSAAEDNDVERVKWLMEHGAAVDQTSTGATALHGAVQYDSREAVQSLLDAGANPNQPDVDGWTPMFSAQSREVIVALRRAGADPQMVDDCGLTPEEQFKDPILKEASREPC